MNDIDPLHKIETLTRDVNAIMERETKSVFERYPLTFTLLVVFGFIALSEGLKNIIEGVPFLLEHPISMSLAGLLILIFTGTLYKRLDK